MAHVSRPLLVVLGATAALLVLWLVALRPQPVAVENTPLASTQAIPKANPAAAASDAANARVQAATGSPGAAAGLSPGAAPPNPQAPAPPAAATPKASAPKAATPSETAARSAGERRDAAVARDIAAGKVVVLLFWNPAAADDIAVRSALRGLDRRGGKVVVRVVPISRVADYESITQGVKIAQSPTTVVVGRKGRARAIVGLTESREIEQAVGDALAGR